MSNINKLKQQGIVLMGLMAVTGVTGPAIALDLSLGTIKARPQDLAAVGITANGEGVSPAFLLKAIAKAKSPIRSRFERSDRLKEKKTVCGEN